MHVCSKKIGLIDKSDQILANNVSPDGKYVIICTNGLKIYKFELSKHDDKNKIQGANPRDDSAA